MSRETSVSCPVCLGEDCRRERRYKGYHEIFANRFLSRCTDCGMVFADPMPSDREWEAYNREFFSESLGGMPDNERVAEFSRGIARTRLDYIAARAKDGLPNSVLEIGPGPGYFFQAYSDRVPGVRYTAVETDSECRTSLREVGVEVEESFDDLGKDVNHFGLVVMSHVLEHSTNPREFLGRALGLLQPGGGLFIEVPCSDYNYKPVFDAHVLFFDKAPMARLLDDLGACDWHIAYYGESIRKLRRQVSLPHRLVNRVKRFGEACGVPPSSAAADAEMDPTTWAAHIENDEPARWLRVMAWKRDGG
jgi:SAM-dependent methyltransferase